MFLYYLHEPAILETLGILFTSIHINNGTLSHVIISKNFLHNSHSRVITANLLVLFNSIDGSDIIVWNISCGICHHMSCIPPVTISTVHKFQIYTTDPPPLLKPPFSRLPWVKAKFTGPLENFMGKLPTCL